MSKPNYPGLKLFRCLLEQARPFHTLMFIILVLNLIATPLAFLTCIQLKVTVDNVFGSNRFQEFFNMIIPFCLIDQESQN